jgi:Tfp pilus assembly protein PilN
MPPPLKKSDQSQGPLVPAWHPNFRNHERLPDTKVVRTQFFVNFAAIAVAASLLLYFSYQEYRIKNLRHQVAEWQSQIDTNRKASAQAQLLSRKFGEEEKKIDELNNFLKQRMELSEFLQHIGSTLPPEMAVDAVEVRETGVDLRGVAAGTPDEASGRTSAYVEMLKQDKYLLDIFEDVALNRLERAQGSERLTFAVFLRFKGAVVKK